MIASAALRLSWRFHLLLQILGEHLPEMRVRLNQAGDIGKILELLALSSPGLGPGLHLAFESVLQRGDPQENAMHVGRPQSLQLVFGKLL